MKNLLLHAVHLAQSAIRERRKAKERSPEWSGVRDRFLASHPECSACGGKKRLQVHHSMPYHLRPELELVESNLLVLCMGRFECHLAIGHGDDFRAWNPLVAHHAVECRQTPTHRKLVEEAARASRRYAGIASQSGVAA